MNLVKTLSLAYRASVVKVTLYILMSTAISLVIMTEIYLVTNHRIKKHSMHLHSYALQHNKVECMLESQ